MRRSSYKLPVAAAFLLLMSAAASPLQQPQSISSDESWSSLSGWNSLRLLPRASDPPLQEKRQTVNCTDTTAAYNSACWQELQLSNFLLGGGEWGLGWNKTTPVCDSQSTDINNNDGTNCCLPTEAWTTCFLRLAQGGGTQDCSQINAQFCSMPTQDSISKTLAGSIRPEVQYIQKNIYGILNSPTSLTESVANCRLSGQRFLHHLLLGAHIRSERCTNDYSRSRQRGGPDQTNRVYT